MLNVRKQVKSDLRSARALMRRRLSKSTSNVVPYYNPAAKIDFLHMHRKSSNNSSSYRPSRY